MTRTASSFYIGQKVQIRGALRSGCNTAIIIDNMGECKEGESPFGKGYYLRFSNGNKGGNWFDHDLQPCVTRNRK